MSIRNRRRRQTLPTLDLPDLPRRRPRFRMLDRDDCLRLHRASLQVLRETGVEVFHEEARRLLRQGGAAVEGDRVRIPPSLVEGALATAPRRFSLYTRGGEAEAIVLDGVESYFGPGSDTFRYLDPRSGERRPFKLADIAASARLCDALPQIDFVMSMGVPSDVPTDGYFAHQYATLLRHSTKPMVVVCDSLAEFEGIVSMGAAVAGGLDQLSERPNILLYSEPTTPLQHSGTATDKLLFCAGHRLPVTHSPAPMMGGTAPITAAGAVVLGNAEALSSIVIHQLRQPGAPFLYGHGVHHLDMKTMVSVYGAPEFQLARVMAAEMGRFYGLPVWGYAGHTDSKLPDGQAAADAQFSVLVALLADTNLNHDIGYVESGLATSPELIVLTDEIISQTRRFVAGVRLDEKALALEAIAEVGPGGEFLSHDHSLSQWRSLWVPDLFDRQRLEPWQEDGRRDINSRLRERAVDLMDSHSVPPLSAAAEAEIERVLQLRD